MNKLKTVLGSISRFMNERPVLKRLLPVVEAFKEAMLGTGRTSPGAPHIRDSCDVKRYMSMVIIALVPAVLGGIYFYGLRVLAVIMVSYVFGGAVEIIFSVVRRKPLYEGFLVTGLIFPLILPPTIPLWMVALGIVFGVFFGKEVFGGTGRNIFNPALVGRVFLSMAFPKYFATMWSCPLVDGLGGFVRYAADAVTTATPLVEFKSARIVADLHSLLVGLAPGSIGETFRIGILAGGLFLILVRIADWRIPFSYLVSVAGLAAVGHALSADQFAPPLFQLFSGGLLFGAFFMATDPVTAPLTVEGKWVFGVIVGVLTVLIRSMTGFVEGVMFAILLGNGFAPLIDSVVLDLKFKKLEV